MTRLKFLAALALLCSVSGTSVHAQTIIRDASDNAQAYAAAELARPARSHVWPAPVGHRQPRAADVPSPSSVLDRQDDARIDQRINICRGC